MKYIKIPLDKLDVVRLQTRASLKQLEQRNGKRYTIRTFYLGPRKKRQGTTNKTDAYAAKIAIYEIRKFVPISSHKEFVDNVLVSYI